MSPIEGEFFFLIKLMTGTIALYLFHHYMY